MNVSFRLRLLTACMVAITAGNAQARMPQKAKNYVQHIVSHLFFCERTDSTYRRAFSELKKNVVSNVGRKYWDLSEWTWWGLQVSDERLHAATMGEIFTYVEVVSFALAHKKGCNYEQKRLISEAIRGRMIHKIDRSAELAPGLLRDFIGRSLDNMVIEYVHGYDAPPVYSYAPSAPPADDGLPSYDEAMRR